MIKIRYLRAEVKIIVHYVDQINIFAGNPLSCLFGNSSPKLLKHASGITQVVNLYP